MFRNKCNVIISLLKSFVWLYFKGRESSRILVFTPFFPRPRSFIVFLYFCIFDFFYLSSVEERVEPLINIAIKFLNQFSNFFCFNYQGEKNFAILKIMTKSRKKQIYALLSFKSFFHYSTRFFYFRNLNIIFECYAF